MMIDDVVEICVYDLESSWVRVDGDLEEVARMLEANSDVISARMEAGKIYAKVRVRLSVTFEPASLSPIHTPPLNLQDFS